MGIAESAEEYTTHFELAANILAKAKLNHFFKKIKKISEGLGSIRCLFILKLQL